MSLVAGVCWAFRGKDAGSVDSGAIGATGTPVGVSRYFAKPS